MILAYYLLNLKRTMTFNGIDFYISYENVISAYLTAGTSNNHKLANKIELLLKKRISGYFNSLQNGFDINLLKYIYDNGDLNTFISGISESMIKEYFVFEDGNFSLVRVPNIYI